MSFFGRRHAQRPVDAAAAWLDADGSPDWPGIERSALVARSLGRLSEADDARTRNALFPTSSTSTSSAPALVALAALDTIARSGGEAVRASLAAANWPALLARLASQAGRGAPPPPPALAAVQLLIDWAAAFSNDALGFEAGVEVRALAQTAPRGSGLATAARAEPTPGARVAAASAAAARGRPPPPSAPAERGMDFLTGFLGLPVTQAASFASPARATAAAPPPPPLDAESLVARFTDAAARLARLTSDLRAALVVGGGLASAALGPLLEDGDAAVGRAAGWAREVQAAVAGGWDGGGEAAALAGVLDALDTLNSARQAWGGVAGRARGGGGGPPPSPPRPLGSARTPPAVAAAPLPPPATAPPPPALPPPPAPRPTSGGTFWARFDEAATPPSLPAPAPQPPAPPAPAAPLQPLPPPSTTAAPAMVGPSRPLPPLPPPATPTAAALAAYARQPALRVRFTPGQFVRLAARVQGERRGGWNEMK